MTNYTKTREKGGNKGQKEKRGEKIREAEEKAGKKDGNII